MVFNEGPKFSTTRGLAIMILFSPGSSILFIFVCCMLLICSYFFGMESNFFYQGVLIGLAAFFIIGVFHPVVIKMEYHFGRKSWWALAIPGIAFLAVSLFVDNDMVSILLGVLAFACFWSVFEIFKQHQRVIKGRAKKNPRRAYP